MNKKWYPYILLGGLLLLIVLIKIIKKEPILVPAKKTTTTRSTKTDRSRGFDRRVSYLQYSAHAKCRMKCRKITQAEVKEIMQDGKINYYKSDLQNARCPRYAVEGITDDGQRVRIIYAQCSESTTVVTVIDLEHEYDCQCPGDDEKYKNKR
ncbi:MAG TPA: DUF4258 domain-containing protein [Chitinophagaceae bacterium]|nr:DUF4258 domain-containing protein [Chitinophagaceae bacterium]HQV05993.1 DUF4258 domain-containing protein [Chitinophagaceae bacterium]